MIVKVFKVTFFFLYFVAIPVACSGKVAQHQYFLTTTEELTQIPLTATEITLGLTPNVTIYQSSEQVSDGRLLLSIEEVESGCHQMSNPIRFRLTFQNITTEPLSLSTRFASPQNGIHYPELLPLLSTEDGSPLFLAHHLISDYWPSEPINIIEIPGNGQYDVVIDYEFPKSVPVSTNQRVTPSPGLYKIRFIYIISSYFESTVWTGIIASNQIEFCVIE